MIPRPAGWRAGRPAPWAGTPGHERLNISLERVRRALTAQGPSSPGRGVQDVAPAELPPVGDDRPASVLCLLFEEAGEAHVVLTRRARHLRAHAGEVSFPGGRLRPGESPLSAALREAEEEVGVPASSVEVIGHLTPLTTRRSPALVNCFVGTFAGPGTAPGLTPNSEVAKLFWVTLAALAAPGVFREELWPAPAGPADGGDRAVPFFDVAGEVVWGATGRLLTELLELTLVPPNHGAVGRGTLYRQ